jgi:DNA-binding protein YbaB
MENMGTYTPQAFKKMTEGAADFAKGVTYSQGEIVKLQSQLGLVGNISDSTMGRMLAASADIASKFDMGLSEGGDLLAKAINNPEMGRRLAMRLKIDPAVIKSVQDLAKHGQIAEAQMKLLEIVEGKVGGAAKAAFDADPLAQYNKAMYDIKVTVGELATSVLRDLMPTIQEFVGHVKDLAHWLKDNGKQLWIVIKALGELYIVYRVISTAVAAYKALMEGLAVAEVGAATATEGMAAASTAALGPIGLLIVAIGALAIANNALTEAQEAAADSRIKDAAFQKSEIAENMEGDLNTLVAFRKRKLHESSKDARDRTISFEEKELQKKYDEQMDILSGKSTHGFVNSKALAEANEKLKTITAQQQGLKDFVAKGPADILKKKKEKDPLLTNNETKGAKGNKAVTINIKIDSLVKELQIKTTNLKESSAKIQEVITQALMGAVNNSQIIAEH